MFTFSGHKALVNNRSQHQSYSNMQGTSSYGPATCFYTNLGVLTSRFRSCLPPPAVFYQGLRVALLSIFCNHIMTELAATAFTICYGYWKGYVLWGGGIHTSCKCSLLIPNQSWATYKEIQACTYFITLSEPRKISCNLSLNLPTERSQQKFWAFLEECYVFTSHQSPAPILPCLYPAHAAASFAKMASFCLRIAHEDFAIATDVLGSMSLNSDAQWFSGAQSWGKTQQHECQLVEASWITSCFL